MAEPFAGTVVNSMDELPALGDRLDAWLEQSGAGPTAAYALRLALEELLTNRIKYGFGEHEEHRIEIRALRQEDGAFLLTVSDDGDDFNPVAAQDPQGLDNPVTERGIGGLGLHMVKKMCAELAHARKDGINTLTVKVLDKGE